MRLLIIGDLDGQVGAATKIARSRGATVSQVSDIAEALDVLRSGQSADIIMIDVRRDVKGLVDGLAAERIHVPVVGCGVNVKSEDAVRAIKAGAKEYLPLPPEEDLIAAVFEAITADSREMIYSSDAMRQMLNMADQIAASDASVLITGESGTGKEVIARYIHERSNRKEQKFVSVNCAAIPENLLESELFGHEKGAFTGAVARRVGKFEEADHGTLLLDEISEMDLRLQAKLLRAIQEREIDRVGGSAPVKINIRILATSNRNLQDEVADGNFREDLFFRLNVIHLRLPALRERKEDLTPLAEYFIAKYAEANGLPERALSDDALTKLLNYNWPGNVRELENTMHRAVLLARGEMIGPDAVLLTSEMESGNFTLPSASARTSPAAPAQGGPEVSQLVGRTVEDVERELIIHTLDHCLGNRTQAANILGISLRTLRNKLREYSLRGIQVPPAKDSNDHYSTG